MVDVLDATLVRLWCQASLEALGRAREEIDALNVFPVPDGDTGTNLFLTLEAANEAIEALPETADMTSVVRELTRGALLGARGNSGVILSQMLMGIGDVLVSAPRVDGAVLRKALLHAVRLAYEAVGDPVEGTMLSVGRVAAETADATGSDDLITVMKAACEGARNALERTPEQLEVLRRAGVVDAGGRGITVLYDAAVAAVTGVTPLPPRTHIPLPERTPGEDLRADGPAYEVMYLLEAGDAKVPALRQALRPLGDSLVVVGGDGLWNVHVHVDDVGAALEAGIGAGRPYRIRVTHFAATATRQAEDHRPATRGVVALAPGPGLAKLLREAGAQVIEAPPGRRPSTTRVLEAIRNTGAREVVILPNHTDTRAIAEAAAEQARADGLRVAVIPTLASVQALAALAMHEPGRRFDDDVVGMTATAGATRHGEVMVAVEVAMTMAGRCQPGDVLGLIDGDVVLIGSDITETAVTVLDRLVSGGGELVTLVGGANAPADLLTKLEDALRELQPGVECLTYEGGQPEYPVLIGVE